MKKTTLGLLTLTTLIAMACADKVSYTAKNENNNDVEVALFTNFGVNYTPYGVESEKDSTIRVINKTTEERIAYTNLVFDKDKYVVNKIAYKRHFNNPFMSQHIYIRNPENAKLFAKADSIYEEAVKFIKEEQNKKLEAEVKNALEISYK